MLPPQYSKDKVGDLMLVSIEKNSRLLMAAAAEGGQLHDAAQFADMAVDGVRAEQHHPARSARPAEMMGSRSVRHGRVGATVEQHSGQHPVFLDQIQVQHGPRATDDAGVAKAARQCFAVEPHLAAVPVGSVQHGLRASATASDKYLRRIDAVGICPVQEKGSS